MGGEQARARRRARPGAGPLNVDVLVVHPTPAIKPAQNATRTIPIVVLAANPVGTGAAASLARPGGNTTPRMSRVGFLASSDDANGPLFVDQTRAAAQRMGIQILPQFVPGPEKSDAAFAAIIKDRAEALIVQPVFTNEASSASTSRSSPSSTGCPPRHSFPSSPRSAG